MKKLLRGACLMGVVALLATSCNKQKTESMVYRGYSFDTKFDVEYAEGVRAYIDTDYKVKFEAGDQVMLFNIDDENAANSECALYVVDADSYQPTFAPYQADVTISDEMKSAKYAFYPGNNVIKDLNVLANENRATFKLLPTQNYRVVDGNAVIPQEALYMAAKIDRADETNFAFRQICGVLSMKFYSPSGKTVKSIAVTDNNMSLTGNVTLKVDQVDPALMMELFRNYPSNEVAVAEYKDQVGYSVQGSGNTITLDCGTGVALGTTATAANNFMFVLRPLAFVNGFDMTITFSDNSTKTLNVTSNNMIKPNTFRIWPALNVD
jgi:hypothetical protein